MIDLLLIEMCKEPGVSTRTVAEIIQKESAGDENAINVNYIRVKFEKPRSKEDAIALAKSLIKSRHNIDIGLMQINSTNFLHYDLSVKDAFDSCRNIRIGSIILKEAFERASKLDLPPQKTLQTALSIYNSGSKERGFQNGYVAKFYPRLKPPSSPDIFKSDTQIDIQSLRKDTNE